MHDYIGPTRVSDRWTGSDICAVSSTYLAVYGRESGPILRNTLGARIDRHAATRARKNLDRHPNYMLAAFMASGT